MPSRLIRSDRYMAVKCSLDGSLSTPAGRRTACALCCLSGWGTAGQWRFCPSHTAARWLTSDQTERITWHVRLVITLARLYLLSSGWSVGISHALCALLSALYMTLLNTHLLPPPPVLCCNNASWRWGGDWDLDRYCLAVRVNDLLKPEYSRGSLHWAKVRDMVK